MKTLFLFTQFVSNKPYARVRSCKPLRSGQGSTVMTLMQREICSIDPAGLDAVPAA